MALYHESGKWLELCDLLTTTWSQWTHGEKGTTL